MFRVAPVNVHVLYESSNGAEPHGCSVIRLLLPLAHPSIGDFVRLSYSNKIPEHGVDVIIIERLWVHEFNTIELLEQLQSLKKRGVKIIYETDDDLLNIHSRAGDREWPSPFQKNIIRLFAREADGIIVSTANLAKVFAPLNASVHIFHNTLDESLFQRIDRSVKNRTIKFGYMGTFTHLEDLIFISAAVRKTLRKYGGRVEFEIVGIGDEKTIREIFGDAPVTIRRVPDKDVPYERFCAWMIENLHWDFGIAPLLRSVFCDSKSDIKFLDYSIVGIPGIYSNVPAYAATVKHNTNGLLCNNTVEDWGHQLERMIESESLRSSLADAAHDYVKTYRVLQARAVDLLNIINIVAAPQINAQASLG